MDSEEGVEVTILIVLTFSFIFFVSNKHSSQVVWNEALFSSSKKFKAQEEKLKRVFEALTQIEHPNIVHFHHYWLDPVTNKLCSFAPKFTLRPPCMTSGHRGHRHNNHCHQGGDLRRNCAEGG